MKLFRRSVSSKSSKHQVEPSRLCPNCGTPGSITLADLVRNAVSYRCVKCEAHWRVDTSSAARDAGLALKGEFPSI